MKSDVTTKPAVILPKSEQVPLTDRTNNLNNLSSTSEVKSTLRLQS